MYWALEETRINKWALEQPMAYFHMTMDANCVMADEMARWALKAELLSSSGMGRCPRLPTGNKLQDVYEQQGMKP